MDGLAGRARELSAGAALLRAAVAGEGRYLGLWAPPGLGRTAIVAALRRMAETRLQVLGAVADAAEADLPFALLHQLTAGLLHPAAAGGTNDFAATLSAPGADPVAVAEALGTLVDAVAARRPVVCLIDDADQADPASWSVLRDLAATRRRWGLVLTGRRRPAGLSTEVPGRDIELAPLSADDARALVDRLLKVNAENPYLTAELARAVRELGAGNPGVLTRVAAALSGDERAGIHPVRDLRGRAARAAAPLWSRPPLSPAGADFALLWAAAATFPGPTGPDPVPSALVAPAGRDEVLAAGLFTVADIGSVGPVHPLLPAATLETTPSMVRRDAHRRLADALVDVDFRRATWHRAHTATEPDEDLAAALDADSDAPGLSAVPTVRAELLEQAAALSVDPAARTERFTRAASAHTAAGDPARATDLLRRTDLTAAPSLVRARASFIDGLLSATARPPEEAHRRLLEAADFAHGRDQLLELRALAAAAEVAWWVGNADWASAAASRSRQLAPDGAVEVMLTETIAGGAAMFSGDVLAAGERLRQALDAAADAPLTPELHAFAGQAGLLLGDDLAAIHHLEASVGGARTTADRFRLAFSLQLLAAAQTWRGDLAAADRSLAEGRAEAVRTGDVRSRVFDLCMTAQTAALRGDVERAVTATGAALRVVTGHDVGFVPAAALWALGRSDLAGGRLDTAVEHLEVVTDPGAPQSHHVAALFAIPDLVEAAVRAGRPDLIEPALTRFAGWAKAGSPWAAAVLPRLEGLLATDAEADTLFESASRNTDRPFEQARAQLLHGERLRRTRQRVRARAVLEQARDTFDELGVVPWAERAAAELIATAERARRDGAAATRLTPQELTVARLVADGASNHEVAQQLFVSRKTVESHLHKIYTKLGIGSRKDLPGALNG